MEAYDIDWDFLYPHTYTKGWMGGGVPNSVFNKIIGADSWFGK